MKTLSSVGSKVNVSSPKKTKFIPREDLVERLEVAAYMDSLHGQKQADRFVKCGEPGGGFVGVCDEGHQHFCSFSCMLRICPRCSALRSSQLAERLTPALLDLVRESSARVSLKHVILTTKLFLLDYLKVDRFGNIDYEKLNNLKGRMMFARRGAADMFRARYADPQSANYEPDFGCGIGIEFGEGLMLHFHVMALMPFWDKYKIDDVWSEFGLWDAGYTYIKEIPRGDERVIEREIRYVSKYVTKGRAPKNDEDGDRSKQKAAVALFVDRYGESPIVAAMWYLFRGVRRFQTYGSFYGLKLAAREKLVCPECGGELHWRPEIDGDHPRSEAALFILYKANNLSLGRGSDPPEWSNLMLAGMPPARVFDENALRV